MNLYRYSLSDVTPQEDFSLDIAAGSVSYTFHFLWPTFLQEQLAQLGRKVLTLANTDPIIRDSVYDRRYDWVSYYKDLPTEAVDIQTWYESQEYLPQSLMNKSSSVYTALIQERIQQAKEYYREYVIKSEALTWMVEVTYGTDDKVVTNMQLGGWVDYNTGHAFRFVSEGRDSVSFSDLPFVSVEFDIDE